MRSKFILIIVALFSLMLITSSLQAKQETEKKFMAVSVLGDSFGSSTYSVMSGVSSLFKDHSWIRIAVSETPGFVWDIKKMLKDEKAREDTVFPTSPTMLKFAQNGVEPYFKQAHPQVEEMRTLFSFNIGLIGLATLKKELAEPEKCDGKRIGVGRRPQLWWAQFPKTVLEQGYGIQPKYDYMGPSQATSSLLDGTVKFSCSGGYASADLSKAKPADFLRKLEASGRDFYFLDFDQEAIKKAAEASGFGYSPVVVPEGSLPGLTQDTTFIGEIQGFMVHKSFPEDAAYEIVRVMLENYKKLSDFHSLGELCTPESFSTKWTGVQFHEGAKRAFQEAGIEIHK